MRSKYDVLVIPAAKEYEGAKCAFCGEIIETKSNTFFTCAKCGQVLRVVDQDGPVWKYLNKRVEAMEYKNSVNYIKVDKQGRIIGIYYDIRDKKTIEELAKELHLE